MKRLQARQPGAFQDLPAEVQELLAKMREHFPKADLDVLGEAYQFAAQAHHAQTRASGEPYINHSVTAAATLVDLGLDPVTIAAALLHDGGEDTGVTLNEVQARFGTEIASLVDGVTKLGKIEWMSREERQAESLRKMFLAMASDIRIVLIKLADRLHNMRTIQYLPEWKQRRTSQETLDIYAPLAERLGIGRIQRELEDLACAVLQPDSAQEVKNQLVQAEASRSQFLEQVADTLCRELNRAGLRVAREQVTARPKHVYSIWRKMQRPKYAGQPVARIYDRLGVRGIVDDVKDCYAALGVVHSLWTPIPVDFAYRIHTDVGHRCVGAKVNGRLVPLSHHLHTGDIVEVVTSKTSTGPSRDWLTFVATNNARAKIRQWFKKEAREENVQRGRELLEKELRRLGALTALMKPDKLREAAPKFNVGSDEDLLAALGNGDVSLLSVVTALRGEVPAPEAPAPVVPAPAA